MVAITSGKGGVGKTSVAVNLAVSLARCGHRVGILDADFGLGNVDVMLGLTPGSHLGDVLAGEKTLEDIMVDGPGGVRDHPGGQRHPRADRAHAGAVGAPGRRGLAGQRGASTSCSSTRRPASTTTSSTCCVSPSA